MHACKFEVEPTESMFGFFVLFGNWGIPFFVNLIHGELKSSRVWNDYIIKTQGELSLHDLWITQKAWNVDLTICINMYPLYVRNFWTIKPV